MENVFAVTPLPEGVTESKNDMGLPFLVFRCHSGTASYYYNIDT